LIESQLTDLSVIPFDPELSIGAANAVNTCLCIQPHEQVTIITDLASREIAASIVDQVAKTRAPYRTFVLEEVAERPLEQMPAEILQELEGSQVSIFAVQVQTNELKSRMQMTEVVNRRKIRHGHMVNINKQIMMQGMRADYTRVDAISKKVLSIVSQARRITAITAAGTDLTADLSPAYRWLKTSGIISPEKWGNLPGGEVFTTPGEVNGIFVVDGVVGDYLCARYGDLSHTPLHLRIQQNRLTEAWSENKQLQDDFWRYTHNDENSDRVGEFAIGTNIELKDVIGHILQDEKFPGIHIAFGNPYGEHTGADWYSSTHIDVVGLRFNIWADEQQIMENGRFLIEA
jgi:aminopeptidase